MLEWLKLRLRRALPKRSSNPQAPVRLHKETSHLEPCRSTVQCYHRDPLHRKTTLPIQTTLAQILSVYSFPSQAKNILGKCLFFFFLNSPRNKKKQIEHMLLMILDRRKSLNALLIPWCQRACQVLLPIHTSVVVFFLFVAEIYYMKFWQSWQHCVSSKAFQHKQEKK